MANQVIPRLNGDEYQHLYSWYHALSLLKRSERVTRVRVEDADGGSVDDVTVHRESESDKPDEFFHYFFQVKYHENQAQHYTSQHLLERKGNGRSLLQKFFHTWKTLRDEHRGRPIRLHLVSNWSWTQELDKLGTCLSNQDGRISSLFFESGPQSEVGKLREQWRSHLNTSEDELRQFIDCLYFYLGEGCFRQLEQLVSERMEHLGLKHDRNALSVSTDIVREWIRTKQGDITAEVLARILSERDLHLPEEDERCVTVYVNTIASGQFDLVPDFVLDWRRYFEGRPDLKGHQLKRPEYWNTKLHPELRGTLGKVRRTTQARMVRARGLARLSVWFAFGFTFSEVAGFGIEVQQQTSTWRTNVLPADDFRVLSNTELLGERGASGGVTVACGISISGLLDDDVRRHLSSLTEPKVNAVLWLKPDRPLGRDCLRTGADAAALARQVKQRLRDFVKEWGAHRLLIYYFGPLSGACFIGHQLNAVCREIQVMEDQQSGYAPSFLLT